MTSKVILTLDEYYNLRKDLEMYKTAHGYVQKKVEELERKMKELEQKEWVKDVDGV